MAEEKSELRDFIPLAGVFALAIAASVLATEVLLLQIQQSMMVFMGVLFLELGGLKAYNMEGFINAYRSYDLVAKRSNTYAALYPFIELGLGLLYLSTGLGGVVPEIFIATNLATAFFMTLGAAGVFNELRKHNRIKCACLGDVFHVPMTWVTLGEDLLMAGMAVLLII